MRIYLYNYSQKRLRNILQYSSRKSKISDDLKLKLFGALMYRYDAILQGARFRTSSHCNKTYQFYIGIVHTISCHHLNKQPSNSFLINSFHTYA